MIALLRLLERQGLLKGDVNHLQRYALQEIIKDEYRERQKRDSMQFKIQAAIANPKHAREILAQKDEVQKPVVPEIEEEDPENPGFSDEGIDTMLRALKEFGIYAEAE